MNNTNYSSIEIHIFGNENVKTHELSQHLLLPKNIRALVGISHFVMPNNMYNIETFTIIKDSKNYTITQGFYNQDDLTDALLNTVCDDDDDDTLDLILTYDTITMKFTIKGSWTEILEFPFVPEPTTYDSGTNGLVYLPNYFGVTGDISGNNNYYFFDNSFSGTDDSDRGIEGTKSPDLGGTPDIFIRLGGLEYPTVNKYKAIGRIPIDVGIGDFLNFSPTEIVYYLLSNQDILKFNVELIDSKGKPVNINNADWSLTIVMHFQDKGPNPLPNFPTKGCTTGLCLSDFRNTDRPISKDLYNELKTLRRKQKKLRKNCKSLF
tara:strand:+ start:266 stop:1228 length:963 start_codon:yes stop_codon:yes gene_type:complete